MYKTNLKLIILKKKRLIIIIAFGIFLAFILFWVFKNSFSESHSIKSFRLNKQQTITKGEWISNLDSMSGISIRENKIAFFKNMEFTSDDIYEYQIIDSIYKNNEIETEVGEFLMMKDFNDTIYYQIINRNDSVLTIKKDKIKTEIFHLKNDKK